MPVTRVLFAEQSRKHYVECDFIIVSRKTSYPAGEKCAKCEVEQSFSIHSRKKKVTAREDNKKVLFSARELNSAIRKKFVMAKKGKSVVIE